MAEPTPLERAQALLQRGQIEEAIFLCRHQLFTLLSSLAQAARVARPSAGDQDERAFAMNDALYQMGVYAEPIYKSVQNWLQIGQLGINGSIEQITIGDVQAMISSMANLQRLVDVSLELARTARAPTGEPSLPRMQADILPPRPPARPTPAPAPRPQPRQLTAPGAPPLAFTTERAPAVVGVLPRAPHFVGRGHTVMRLAGLLRQGRHVALVPLATGAAGMGLSAVAAETLALLASDTPPAFPGGIIALDAYARQGEDALRWAYTEIGAAWRVPAVAQATTLSGQERELRRVLLNRQTLIALDHVEMGFPIARLVDTLAACGATVLLTSRHVPRADLLSVMRMEPLASGPALTLLQERYTRLGGDPDDWNEAAAREIADLVEQRPLALELATTLATASMTLVTLAQRLAHAAQRGLLASQGEPNQTVRYLLDLALNQMDTARQNCLAALAIFAGPSWSEDAALTVISGVATTFAPDDSGGLRSDAIFAQFTRYHLVQSLPSAIAGVRYRLQPFVRGQLTRLLLDRPVITDWAGHALAAYYAGVALTRRRPGDRDALREDYVNCEAGLQWAHAHNEPAFVVSYTMGLARFWQREGLWMEAERYLNWGVRAANTIGDRPREAQLAQELGTILHSLKRRSEALDWYEQALAIWRDLGNTRSEAAALFELGRMAQETEDLTDAHAYYEASVRAAKAGDDEQGQARALQALGLIEESQGQIEAARRCYELVFEMRQHAGDVIGQAGALNVLGVLEFRQQHFTAARDLLTTSLTHAVAAGNDFWEAEAHFWLGEVAFAEGDNLHALEQWQHALRLYIRQGRMPDAEEAQRRITRLTGPVA